MHVEPEARSAFQAFAARMKAAAAATAVEPPVEPQFQQLSRSSSSSAAVPAVEPSAAVPAVDGHVRWQRFARRCQRTYVRTY